MLRFLATTFAVAATLPVAADVMPHCGGPTVVVQSPGEECGHHGPRWRGDCRAPAACYRMETGGATCTRSCARDADCAPLGPGFWCTGRGASYTNAGPLENLCTRDPKPFDAGR